MEKNKYNKIPLPWGDSGPSDAEIRGRQTLTYWKISSNWNGKGSHNFTVMQAMEAANVILHEIDPQKRLAYLTRELKDNIIEHGTKSKRSKNSNTPAKMIIL
jgi:hypothetical protein